MNSEMTQKCHVEPLEISRCEKLPVRMPKHDICGTTCSSGISSNGGEERTYYLLTRHGRRRARGEQATVEAASSTEFALVVAMTATVDAVPTVGEGRRRALLQTEVRRARVSGARRADSFSRRETPRRCTILL